VVLNAAAYTAVDRAEEDSERAFAVNVLGAEHVARAAAQLGARVIHVSTDFVFDGLSSRPYRPDDAPHPCSAYGRSKLAGEAAVLSAARERAVVVRTAWLYSAHGGNFVKTILRLLAERDAVRVVADQIGTPTWASTLALVLWQLAARPDLRGVFHWTDAGVASWYDFAVAIREEALAAGVLAAAAPVVPIRTEDYPTPAQRPPFSVLDKTAIWDALGLEPRHWRCELRAMLAELATAGPALRSSTSHPFQ
jgi:dTDP-4-dehydrorhamnose reductase